MNGGPAGQSTELGHGPQKTSHGLQVWFTVREKSWAWSNDWDSIWFRSNNCCSLSVYKRTLLCNPTVQKRSIMRSNGWGCSWLWIGDQKHWSMVQISSEARSDGQNRIWPWLGVKGWFLGRSERSNPDPTVRNIPKGINMISKNFRTPFPTKKLWKIHL